MGPDNILVVEQNHVHQEGILLESKVLDSFNLCNHYLIMNHINNVGSKVIPNITMDILDIQCHDVHATLCIGRAIHPQ